MTSLVLKREVSCRVHVYFSRDIHIVPVDSDAACVSKNCLNPIKVTNIVPTIISFNRVLMLLVLVLLGACEGSANYSDAEYIDIAQDYLSKGKPEAAVIELKNALLKNPENPQARLLLGQTYVALGSWSDAAAAEKEFRQAMDLGIAAEAVLPSMAKALLMQQKYDEVLAMPISAQWPADVRTEIHAARGLALTLQHKYEEAATEFDDALEITPGATEALVGRAQLDAAQRNYAAAEELLNDVLARDSSNASAWSLFGDIYQYQGKFDLAEESYTKAIRIQELNHVNILKRAMVRIQLGHYEDAQRDIDKIKKLVSPRYPAVLYAQGMLYLQNKKYQAAQESLEIALQGDGNLYQAVYLMGVTHYMQRHYGQANDYLEKFHSKYPQHINTRKLLALVKMKLHDNTGAEKLIRPVVARNESDVLALNILATALLNSGETGEGITYLKKVAALQPESAGERYRLGLGLMIGGNTEAGSEALETAIEIQPDLEAANAYLIVYYVNTKSYDKAIQAAQDYVKNAPDSLLANTLLGMAYSEQGDFVKAQNAYNKAKLIAPSDPFTNQGLAAIAINDKKPELARKYYDDIFKKYPNHLSTQVKLALLELYLGDRDAFKQSLQKAIDAHPDALEPRLILARAYFRENKMELIPALFNGIRDVNRSNPELLWILGQAQLANGDLSNAKNSITRLIAQQPSNAEVHFMLARIYASMNNGAAANAELEKTLELDPKHFLARILKVQQEISSQNISEAELLYKSLKEESPDNPSVLLIEAQLASLRGDAGKAGEAYTKAYAKAPGKETLLPLVGFRLSTGDADAANKLVEEWLGKNPDDIAVQLQLAAMYQRAGRTQDAIHMYKTVLQVSDTNLTALNNLAWHLRETDPVQAREYAERAYEIAPDSFGVVDTLALVLRKSDTNRALVMIDKALIMSPENPSILYHKALILQTAGKHKEAQQVVRSLLDQHSTFPERGEAVQLLKELKGA
jgi:putative PEP-CTERM system TPR-repeat lipoprotein